MRILVATDAWHPQVNGVVRTLQEVFAQLTKSGHTLEVISPDQFLNVPLPSYREIRLALASAGMLRRRIAEFAPDQVHIATEGPLGLAARSACLAMGLGFTTSYHTRFPEYLQSRLPVPLAWSYAWMRRFHNAGNGCLVAAGSIADALRAQGFNNIVSWSRGVDHQMFKPRPGDDLAAEMGWKRPVFINVGRISLEKNLEAFLKIQLPGTKVVVGDGPLRHQLETRYPGAVFTGAKFGEELARHYAAGDVFVFPSLTDTFGNVLLEAMACGVPVAAFPVSGPLDVIGSTGAGVLDDDLRKAVLAALVIDRKIPRHAALGHGWEECARTLIKAGKTLQV